MLEDLEVLLGLDDFEALRLSSGGQDPDRKRLLPKVRACFKRLGDNGEAVPKHHAEILADFAARTEDDRRLWRRYLEVLG